MASKPSRDKLIHCDACGEDYSATYRRCPFCGERNDPQRSAPPAPADPDDTYVFEGQDAFDDDLDDEEYYAPKPKAGKRLAPKQGGRSVDLPPINWPRLITFLCSLVIIVAALIIVFTVIYPQLHGKNKDPKPSESQSQASENPDPSAGPSPSNVVTLPTVPVEPTADLPPVDTTPVQPAVTGITLKADGRALSANDFTLYVGESTQLSAEVTPAGWSGQVTWTSSNPEWLTVTDAGVVTNVNSSGAYHNVYITIAAGDYSIQCVVRVQSQKRDTSGQPTTPVTTDPPTVTTQTPGTTTTTGPVVGRTGTIVNAEGGLRVRPDPSTSNPPIATLLNGNTITVVADAGNGWYQIQFPGSGGATMTGYIMGEYISGN